MAGERKGKAHEALVKLALDRLRADSTIKAPVQWNVRPEAMSIEPDFTIGADSNNPDALILVTHSGSTKNSDMKFWRNMGELAEAKSSLQSVPTVCSLVFDAEVKEDLKTVQSAAFDGHLIVGDRPYGTALIAWIDEHHDALPARGEEKVEALAGWRATDKNFQKWFAQFQRDVHALLAARQPALSQLWAMHRKRTGGAVPDARNTYYRRSLTKAMALGIKPTEMLKPLKGNWEWAVPLGLLKKSLVGYKVVDEDLLWLAKSPLKDLEPTQWLDGQVTDGFKAQLQKVRSVALLTAFQAYVIAGLPELQTPKGMLKHLKAQHQDPGQGLTLPQGVLAPSGVWMFDYVGALVKAKAKKAQAFGYSSFSSHAKAGQTQVVNMSLGSWCTCFMNQYFTRKDGFKVPAGALEFVALVLSEQLKGWTPQAIEKVSADVQQRYVDKELVAVLFTHRGFDPLGLILSSSISLDSAQDLRIKSCFAERCGVTGNSAGTSVLLLNGSLVNWQSATEAGKDHKKKELCGRAVSLRYGWTGEHFALREGVERMVLVLDGE